MSDIVYKDWYEKEVFKRHCCESVYQSYRKARDIIKKEKGIDITLEIKSIFGIT